MEDEMIINKIMNVFVKSHLQNLIDVLEGLMIQIKSQ